MYHNYTVIQLIEHPIVKNYEYTNIIINNYTYRFKTIMCR